MQNPDGVNSTLPRRRALRLTQCLFGKPVWFRVYAVRAARDRQTA
jgi:hypothetical protein